MRKKVPSLLLTFALVLSLFLITPFTIARADSPAFPAYGWSVYHETGGFTGFVEVPYDSDTVPIGDPVAGGFWMSGADFVGDTLYAVSYADSGTTGTNLYTIDTATGVYTLVGNTGQAFHGFCYDTVTETAYAVSTDGSTSYLYSIDLSTGDSDLIGLINSDVVLGLAADSSGNLYGVGIVGDSLLSIDKTTGAATLLGSLGIDISFAQDIAYDRDNGVLYGTLYTTKGSLYSIDMSGAATWIRDLGAEVDGFAIPYTIEVAEVDGVGYMTLDEAIAAAAANEDTIKLLANINYSGMISPTFDMDINLNGHTLNVVNDSGIGLRADGRDLNINGEGALNVTGTTYGVYTCDGGQAEVTNATATATGGRAVYVGDTNCSVTVYGDITANGENGVAVYTGDIAPCTATIHGDVYANGTGSIGAWATSGSQITVAGRIYATNYLQVGDTAKAEGAYSSVVDNYYIYTDGVSTVRARQEVCSLDGTNYLFLEDALADAEDGDTITLLADIRYEGEIVLTDKALHFDLDTFDLNIGRTGSEGALKVDGGALTIDDTDGGTLNIVDGYFGVYALNGGTATVSSISGLNGYGIVGESGGSVTVKGDISVISYMGTGLTLSGGATAYVMGDIYSLNGIYVSGSGTEATIDGDISATAGLGVNADSGGTVTVGGNVDANYRAISAYGWTEGGGIIHVDGNVTATNNYAVEASAGSTVTIGGDAQSKMGLAAYGEGTTVTVNKNTTTTDAAEYGAYVILGGEITIGGQIIAANYVKINETVMTQDQGVLQGRYTVYSDGVSAVRLKGLEFFKEDFESGMDGWAQSNIGWGVTNTLTQPTASAHSGSYVARFNCFSLGSDTLSRLYQTESLNLTNGSDYWLEFWMYHDSDWSANDDYVIVQVSIDGGSSWTDLGTFHRFGATVWQKEAISLAAYADEPDVRIAFLGVSDFGNNIFIDDVSVSHQCIIDGCSVTEAYGGFIASSEIGGETYYHVSTAEQLAHINDHLDLNFIQTADIDLADYNGGNWIPIGGFGDPDDYCNPEYFTGKYLGGEHTIDNLYCFYDGTQNATHSGVFASIREVDATVSDLTVKVKGANMTNYNYAYFGAVAGNMDGGTIKNCHVVFEGDIVTETPNGYAGGIVGSAYPLYDSESDSYIGSIEDCDVTFDTGSILTEGWSKYAGGIIGRGAVSIIDCHVVIDEGETIKAPIVGGIAGSADKMKPFGAYMENCTVTGAGTLELFPQDKYSAGVGGIAGSSYDGDLRNCDNEVDIIAHPTMIREGQSIYAGGIVGNTGPNTSVFGCDNTGDVDLVIANNVVDSDGNATTPVGDEYAYAGGITGFINGYTRAAVIENCENNANITATNLIPTNRAYAGGIVGHIECDDGTNAGVTVKNCANTGADKTVGTYAGSTLTGGIAGSSTYTDFDTPNILIENCYNKSSVYSESNSAPKVGTMCIGLTAGGIIGAAGEVMVNYCYSTASDVNAINNHDGDAYIGGIVGLIYNTALSQNYYETNSNVTRAVGGIVSGMDIVPQADVAGSYEGATAQELKTKSFYGSGWSWYTSGGSAPDYYSSTNPWRMTSSASYPLLKGAPYNAPVNPPSGGGGTIATYYSITASAGNGGSIDPSGNIRVQKDASKSFAITPEPGYMIADVLVDGVSVGAVKEYTFSQITENHTINATFEHPSKRFSDVDGNLWYREGIDYVVFAGLFNGITETTFEPNSNMTRAMLVTVLWRLENEPDSSILSLFSDIADGIWYTEAVAWAAENKIVDGYNEELFGPDDPITREQMAAILYRYASYKGYDITAMDALSSFNDVGSTSNWALKAVKWAVAGGLINGVSEKRLDSAGKASRAQVATILMRFVEKYR